MGHFFIFRPILRLIPPPLEVLKIRVGCVFGSAFGGAWKNEMCQKGGAFGGALLTQKRGDSGGFMT